MTYSVVEMMDFVVEMMDFVLKMTAQAFGELKKWAKKGQGHSETRKGSWPDDYRHLMKEI